jgi:hypothetical protein
MNYTAQVKEISKIDKPPFGDGILTYKMKTSKHEGFLYTPKLNLEVGDEISYEYLPLPKSSGYKFYKPKKVGMYNNYKKDTSTQSVSKPLDTHNSILRQVAFKGAIELASSGKINIQEIEEFTNTFNQILK